MRLTAWTPFLLVALLVAACSPSAPASPTAAPAKPTAASGGPAAASSPAASKPAAAASPASGSQSGAPAAAPATKSSNADYAFFGGKTVRIIVPFAPGGGQDVTARLFASRWSDQFPNKPNFIVENMPGAGGAVGMRELIEKRSPDGLSLIVPGSGVALRWLLKEQGHNYPMEKMPAIGALPSGTVTVARRDVGDTLEKLIARKEPLRSGHNAPGALGPVHDVLIFRMLGVPLDIVYGFPGYGEIAIAVERGEIQQSNPGMLGYIQTWKPMEDSKIIWPIFQIGQLDERGDVKRSPIMPDLPTGYEEFKRIKGQEPSGDDWEAYRILIGMSALSGIVLAHPDTPADRLAALQESFLKMTTDPAWGPETARVLGQPAPAVGSDAANASMQVMIKAPPSVVETLSQAGR